MPAAATRGRALALLGALVVGAVAPRAAPAQDVARARLDVYGDDAIVVVAPAASLAVDGAGPVDVEVGWMANVLSGATPLLLSDAVSSATTFREVRQAGDLTLRAATDPLTTLSGAGTFSLESDYLVAGGTFSGQRELAERMVVLSGSLSTLAEHGWTTSRDGVTTSALTQRGDLGASFVLSPRARLSVAGTAMLHGCDAALGCQANPYRYVALGRAEDLLAVRERHPDRRGRLAVRTGLRGAIGRHVALAVAWRGYADTWGVAGQVGDLELALAAFEERLILRLEGRLAWQEPARFFDAHPALQGGLVPAWRTADRELSRVLSGRVGGSVEWALLGLPGLLRLAVSMRLHWTRYSYPLLPWAERRDAFVGGVGFAVER